MINSILEKLATGGRAGEPLPLASHLVQALTTEARQLIHQLLTDVADHPRGIDRLLDAHCTFGGDEFYLQREAALSVKVASGGHPVFATVACKTLLVNLRGGDLVVDCFVVEGQRARFDKTLRIKPETAFLCADPGCAYHFSAPDDTVLLAKLQIERQRPLSDYQHLFALSGPGEADYQATVPFDFGAYHAIYHLGMAHSLGCLATMFERHKNTLLAGPTPFLWEAATLFIRARHTACYAFLDALIARNDDNFLAAATETRANIAEVIPRAD